MQYTNRPEIYLPSCTKTVKEAPQREKHQEPGIKLKFPNESQGPRKLKLPDGHFMPHKEQKQQQGI